jgi:hypothetical protein
MPKLVRPLIQYYHDPRGCNYINFRQCAPGWWHAVDVDAPDYRFVDCERQACLTIEQGKALLAWAKKNGWTVK